MNRYAFSGLLLMLMCGTGVSAEKKRVAIADLVGDWNGTSLCQVKSSPCHDEQVVFRLSHPQQEKIRVQADKIVDGKAVTMGPDDWPFDALSQALIYEIPSGTWKLIVQGNEMNGTLITRDNVLFRKVHLDRSK